MSKQHCPSVQQTKHFDSTKKNQTFIFAVLRLNAQRVAGSISAMQRLGNTNIAAVASSWRHCDRLDRPRNRTKTSTSLASQGPSPRCSAWVTQTSRRWRVPGDTVTDLTDPGIALKPPRRWRVRVHLRDAAPG